MITLLGWLGALLALAAYVQTGTARFRQIALLSSAALLTFNVLLGIWSNVALESTLAIVNVSRLVQLRGSRRATSQKHTDCPSPVPLGTCDVGGPSIRHTTGARGAIELSRVKKSTRPSVTVRGPLDKGLQPLV